jgi:peptidoglycan/LPS O-acetylase OafA/YrhL
VVAARDFRQGASVVGGRRLGYVPALDGVRGVAIAAVLGVHFFGLPGGAYGVDVFFVLSGFLITTLLLEEHAKTGTISLRGFYLRRARRLLPALGGVLVFVALLASSAYEPGRLIEVLAAGGLYAANIVRAAFPSVLSGTALDHTWSLAMEEQFYFVWPLVLIVLLRRRVAAKRMMTVLAASFVAVVVYRAGLVAAGASYHRVYFAPDTRADGLVAGCLLAFLRLRDVRLPMGASGAALSVLVAAFALTVSWQFSLAVGLPIVEIASAALILAVTTPCAVARLLSTRPMVWLGKISYSLYLWHGFVRWLDVSTLQKFAVAVALTLVSFYVLERPFRRKQHAPLDAIPGVTAVTAA